MAKSDDEKTPFKRYPDSGQLPVHQIDIQDTQVFCIFLKVSEPEKDAYLLSGARLVCIYYIRENLNSGIWIGLPILEDCILEFSVSPQGRLLYKDKPVDSFKDAVINQYIAQTKIRLLKEEALRKTEQSTVPLHPAQSEYNVPAEQTHNNPVEREHQKQERFHINPLKIKVSHIIEKRLQTYSNIVLDVDPDWLEETTIGGKQCIVIDLDKQTTQTAEILSKMELYRGQHKSIERVGNQIIFKGYA